MPDKQNESKFMAMLERRGIIRKTDAADESTETAPKSAAEQPEVDLRSGIVASSSTSDTKKVTPAARQPVPGMLNTVIPTEQPQQIERELAKSPTRAGFEHSKPVVQAESEKQPKPVLHTETAKPSPEEHIAPEPPIQPSIPKPSAFFSGADYKGDIPMDRQPKPPVSSVLPDPPPFAREMPRMPQAPAPFTPVSTSSYEQQAEQKQPSPESYTDRYLDIEELYSVLSMKSKRTDTIYLIEEYLKTLPESLPDESRREIVSRIVAASGFDFDLLMGDGVLRVKMLREYAERFARHTDEYILARNGELDELEQQIMRIRRLVENRRELHKKQFFAIEAEAQRLKEILTFISG